jgi:lysine biosynthesis protein LysW
MNEGMDRMPTAHCIECDEEIELEGRARIGQKVTCTHCGADLEVVGVDPVELDWADEDEAEEWDEELDEELDVALDEEIDVETDEEIEEEIDEEFDDFEDELEDEIDDESEDEDEFDLDDDFGDLDDEFGYDELGDDDNDGRWN